MPNNPDLKALERLCPEAAELKTVHQKWVDYFRNDDDLIKAVDQTIEAIAACIVRLGKEAVEAYEKGVIEGKTTQAKLEIQGRDRFLKTLRKERDEKV